MKMLLIVCVLAVAGLFGGCVTQADTVVNLNAVNAVVINTIARVNADPLNPNNARDLADANNAESQALALNAKAVSVNVADLSNIVNLAENLLAWILQNTHWFVAAKMDAKLVPPETTQQLMTDAAIQQWRLQQSANVKAASKLPN
jgi:hypothetical protein